MYEIYKVQTGDTLDSIANKYGTTQALLLQINGLPDSYTPLPNSEIIVPLNQNSTYKYYTVKKGDNIGFITEDGRKGIMNIAGASGRYIDFKCKTQTIPQ